MPWKEVQPGHWERPLGDNEAMIKMIADAGQPFNKDAWCISATAEFSAKFPDNTSGTSLSHILYQGWKYLRFHHPAIAATVSGEFVRYCVPSETDLDNWAKDSFIVVDRGLSVSDVVAQMTPRSLATIFYIESSASLVLQLAHWRTDGVGALQLLDAYFQVLCNRELHDGAVNKLSWGDEVQRLTPAVEEALGLSTVSIAEQEASAQKYLGTLAHTLGSLNTPYISDASRVPGATRISHLVCSTGETAEIEAECSRRGISLQSAVHASVSATAFEIADSNSTAMHHSTTLRHSLRPHLPSPYNASPGAAGLYTAGYMVKVFPSQTWMECALQYESEYEKGATTELLASRGHYAKIMAARLAQRIIPKPPPSGLDMSYIPNVDSLVQTLYHVGDRSLEVRKVAIQVQVISRHMYIFALVFGGRLQLQLVYNESYYSNEFAATVTAKVHNHLVANSVAERQ